MEAVLAVMGFEVEPSDRMRSSLYYLVISGCWQVARPTQKSIRLLARTIRSTTRVKQEMRDVKLGQ